MGQICNISFWPLFTIKLGEKRQKWQNLRRQTSLYIYIYIYTSHSLILSLSLSLALALSLSLSILLSLLLSLSLSLSLSFFCLSLSLYLSISLSLWLTLWLMLSLSLSLCSLSLYVFRSPLDFKGTSCHEGKREDTIGTEIVANRPILYSDVNFAGIDSRISFVRYSNWWAVSEFHLAVCNSNISYFGVEPRLQLKSKLDCPRIFCEL